MFSQQIIDKLDSKIIDISLDFYSREIKYSNNDKETLFELKELIQKEIATYEKNFAEKKKPLKERIDSLNDIFKPKIESLKQLKIIAIQKITEIEKSEKETSIGSGLDAIKALSTGNGRNGPTSQIQPASKKLTKRKILKFKVLDFSKVPRRYLLPYDTMIKKAGKSGEQIDGIKFYYEETGY